MYEVSHSRSVDLLLGTKNINVDVMKRILKVLHEQGTLNVTNLAMSSHVNYNTCKGYLHIMKIFDWIEISNHEKNTAVRITDTGRKIFIKLDD